jgi:hypothetical protein
MRKPAHFLLAIGLASVTGFAQRASDFRQATWGMTKAQVLASEAKRPSDVRQSNGETIVQYDAGKVAGLNATVLYIFAKDKLVRAKYLLNAQHDELNDFIADFHAVETLLKSAYGEPTLQKAVWEDDSLVEERKAYLDQDRATPESILPSDRNVGLAVSLGHLKLYTERGEVTRVLHAMTGADGHITHQIEYRSVESGALEDEAHSARRETLVNSRWVSRRNR